MESVETELSDAKKEVLELCLKIAESNLRSKERQRKPKWRERYDQYDAETSVKNEDEPCEEVVKELEHVRRELRKLKRDMARVLKEKRDAERAARASSSKQLTLLTSMELMKKEIQELGEAPREEDEDNANERQVTLVSEELEGAKQELASVKGEGFNFMTSMDVIQDELTCVRVETARLQKAERKRELTIQSLNSKILRAKAKLESLTSVESKTDTVASNLVVTLEQLRSEAETVKKEEDVISEETENTSREICKTEHEIKVAEKTLEAAMEVLTAIKSSESKALGNLKSMINTAMEARNVASINNSMITITDFEYGYLTGQAGGAAEVADKKIAAAKAWVEALKANERGILMKIEMVETEASKLSIEPDAEADADGPGFGLGERIVASGRRSMARVGSKAAVRRARLQKLRSSTTRYSGKMGSFRREKGVPKLV
ncbi:putative WEB family protein [Helianthus anomalus]